MVINRPEWVYKMDVVHVCGEFSPLSETFIYDYVIQTDKAGADCHVLTLRRTNADERSFAQVTEIPIPPRWNPKRLAYRFLVSLGLERSDTYIWPFIRPHVEEILQDIRPDVLHAHFGPLAVMVAPIARSLEIPLVTTFYGYDASELAREERWQVAYRELWNAVDLINALSEEMKKRLIHDLGAPEEKVRVIHLGRDLEKFAYRDPDSTVRTFVSVGRLTEKKGHLDALEAFRRVIQDASGLELRIIGDGDQLPEIQQFVERHNMEKYVKLLGWRTPAEVVQELRAADAFILSSKTASNGDKEGTPTVIIEAQAVGLPVISTRHAGIPEMVPEENHFLLAEGGDVDQISQSILKLCRCSVGEVQAIARAGREKVVEDFNIAKESEKLIRQYEEISS